MGLEIFSMFSFLSTSVIVLRFQFIVQTEVGLKKYYLCIDFCEPKLSSYLYEQTVVGLKKELLRWEKILR